MADVELAVVTGGNRGLGLETCRQLAARQMRVVLASRDPERGRRAADQLAIEGLGVVAMPLDVSSALSVEKFARQMAERYGRVDVLVNNAGIALDGFNAEVARHTLVVNFFGALHVTEALLPLIATKGRVVMVSSSVGQLDGFPNALRRKLESPQLDRGELATLMQSFVNDVRAGRHKERGWPSSAYKVSKAGLNALTRVFARELAGRDIRVNAVCPGWVRTDMGGKSASRGVDEGASGIVWAATLPPDGPSGGFFRDSEPIPW
jgi:carbonyl reductase 1